jgi:hypothetical protein
MSRVGATAVSPTALTAPTAPAVPAPALLAQAKKYDLVKGLGTFTWIDGSSGQTRSGQWPIYKDDNWNLGGYFINDPSGKRVDLDAWTPRVAYREARTLVWKWLSEGRLKPASSLADLSKKWDAIQRTITPEPPNSKPLNADVGVGEVQGATKEGKVFAGLLIMRTNLKDRSASFYIKGAGPQSHSLPKDIQDLEGAKIYARQLIASGNLKNFFREGEPNAFQYQSIRVDLGNPQKPSPVGQFTGGVLFPKFIPERQEARAVAKANNIPVTAAGTTALLPNTAEGGQLKAQMDSVEGGGALPSTGAMSPAFKTAYEKWSRVYASAKVQEALQNIAQGSSGRPRGGVRLVTTPRYTPSKQVKTSGNAGLSSSNTANGTVPVQTNQSHSDVSNLKAPSKIKLQSSNRAQRTTASAVPVTPAPLPVSNVTTVVRPGVAFRIDLPLTGHKVVLEIWGQRISGKNSAFDLKAITKMLEANGYQRQAENTKDVNKFGQWIAKVLPANIGVRVRVMSPPPLLGARIVGASKDGYLETNTQKLINSGQVIRNAEGKLQLDVTLNSRGEYVLKQPLEITVGERYTANPAMAVPIKIPLGSVGFLGPAAGISYAKEAKIRLSGVIGRDSLNAINTTLNNPSNKDFYRNAGDSFVTQINQRNYINHEELTDFGGSKLPKGVRNLKSLLLRDVKESKVIEETTYSSGVGGGNVSVPNLVSGTAAIRIEKKTSRTPVSQRAKASGQ